MITRCFLNNQPTLLWSLDPGSLAMDQMLQAITCNLHCVSNLPVSIRYHLDLSLVQWYGNPLLCGWDFHTHFLLCCIRVVYLTHNALPETLLFWWAEAAMLVLQAHHANGCLVHFRQDDVLQLACSHPDSITDLLNYPWRWWDLLKDVKVIHKVRRSKGKTGQFQHSEASNM